MGHPDLSRLRCPRCRSANPFELHETERDAFEVRAGELCCGRCAAAYRISDGIVDLLADAPAHVRREAAGLERFAETMRADGWDAERILALPAREEPYWYEQATSFEQLVEAVDPQPGETLLDVGSNTCWASAAFARRGLDVIALDIATTKLQGLKTAELFFADGQPRFERVLGSMADLPIADQSLDLAFCCEVLHHNDPGSLRATWQELARVLRPGGRVLVANEPLRGLRNQRAEHAADVEAYDGYEHVYFAHRYLLPAVRVGFSLRPLPPLYDNVIRDPQRSRVLRGARWAWRALITGEVALTMVATKRHEDNLSRGSAPRR